MFNISHYRISHRRKYAITKRTPIERLNASQRLRLHLLQVNLDEYRMQPCHTLIEHVKTVNNMIQVIIFNGNILNKESKYDALYNTLPLNYKGSLHFISESGEINNYETLVYIFLEANTWHNLTKSAILTETIKEALECPTKEKWKVALEEEIKSMKVNQVWSLVDLPPDRKAIGNEWILKIKRKSDGSIDRYKDRLMAKGYTQKEGIDCEETFSPVVRFTSIQLLLAIVTNLNLELHQMDVKTAFLNGELDEKIYMEQPVDFIVKGKEHKVCKLQRSIYGLKQSSRQWYLRFHKVILTYDFKIIDEDHNVYVKRTSGKFVILSLFVDDILIAGSDKEYLMDIKRWLSTHFDMQDMGEANYILGVKIKKDRSKKILALSQDNYI